MSVFNLNYQTILRVTQKGHRKYLKCYSQVSSCFDNLILETVIGMDIEAIPALDPAPVHHPEPSDSKPRPSTSTGRLKTLTDEELLAVQQNQYSAAT